MTTMSSTFLQRHGASPPSIEVEYLRLSVDEVHSLAQLVSQGLQLNGRQCQDLSSKLVQSVENIQKLVPPSPKLNVLFGPALKNLYKVLTKAKLLVHQCCNIDWCRAAVFQIHNEWAFREVLLEVGLSYNVIYELTKRILRDWEWSLIQAEDLRHSSLFLPAFENEIREDQETLKRRLEHVASTPDDGNAYLARYLLGKLECIFSASKNEDFRLPDALLWMKETEPQETWKLKRVLGSGSGAICVCHYQWLGVPCARKEFHCKVPDVIFRREVAILAQLNHPNIVKFFCCGIASEPEMDKCFIAMELMEMSLDSLIEGRAKQGQSFPILLVLDIMTQIARGVCYLHGLKIAHRDLKPLNVVVTDMHAAHLEGCFCVKLVDFGMSKTKVLVCKSNTISIPGVGTTKYRAPEVFPQAQRVAPGLKKKVNWFQADAYSFGITCAVLLSLKRPFEDVPASELFEELLQGVRPKLPGECPEALVALLRDCWATNPQARPSFAEICSRVEQCKLQELLRVSPEGLQGVVGREYVETVSMKQSQGHSQGATRVSSIQSECASTVPFNSDAAKGVIGNSQFDEEASAPSDAYSEDGQGVFLSESEPKKNVSLWSLTMSSLARVSTDALLSKKIRESRSLRRKFQLKCEEFNVKPTLFPYNVLRVATRDFHPDMKLGESSSGVMYKGVLPNGSVVAVKKVSSLCSIDFFLNEVVLLSGMKHKNLVMLKGCCLHDSQGLLVYEYVENVNVFHILLDKRSSRQVLSWPVRLKICLGVAQGLHYLHALTHPKIIHGRIMSRAVFLDRNFDPKIGDFNIAFLIPDEHVTSNHVITASIFSVRDHMAPEYFISGILSDKTDVYSFGVLCLEIISGRRWVDMTAPPDQTYIQERAWQLHNEGRLSELFDPTMHLTNVEFQEVHRVIKLCLHCIQKEAEVRPSMARIVSILQGDTEWDGQVKRVGGHCVIGI